jgi:hypothetical protein
VGTRQPQAWRADQAPSLSYITSSVVGLVVFLLAIWLLTAALS